MRCWYLLRFFLFNREFDKLKLHWLFKVFQTTCVGIIQVRNCNSRFLNYLNFRLLPSRRKRQHRDKGDGVIRSYGSLDLSTSNSESTDCQESNTSEVIATSDASDDGNANVKFTGQQWIVLVVSLNLNFISTSYIFLFIIKSIKIVSGN
jgi:hypothetical protein